MTRVEEFDTFYNSTRRYILHLTYALCGDRNTAATVVTDAYRNAWQQWPKLRGSDTLEFLRNEAWRLSVFERGKHPWRRRHEEDSDLGLIAALQRLSPNSRRLVVLQSLGEISLEAAARDVGMTYGAALEATQAAISSLEKTMLTDLEQIERRLRALSIVSDRIPLPRPHGMRREAKLHLRRRTAAVVAVVAAAVVGAGLVSTESSPMNHAVAATDRQQLGAETQKLTPVGSEIDAGALLDSQQISGLHPKRTWQVDDTADDTSSGEPYAVCAPRRFADRNAHEAYVRSFSASGKKSEEAVEAVEVSRDDRAAERTYQRMVRWYANCATPRVQLVDSYTVQRPEGHTRIFRLRHWEHPARTVTVGVSRTGVATSALVHSVDGGQGVDVDDFAATVQESLTSVCAKAGGPCPDGGKVAETLPAPTRRAKAFLGVVDLPPIADVDEVWAGTKTMKARPNPAATLCDKAKFSGKKVETARSRVFVIPEEKRLPKEFGLSETVGRFTKKKAAKRFVEDVSDKINECEKDNLSATIGKPRSIKGKTATGEKIKGTAWKVGFEINKKKKVHYRVAVVRQGRDVAQVSFSPADGFDLEPAEFTDLARRSGERLSYLP